MGQTANTNDDDLPQLRANLTEATQSVLSHLQEPQETFGLKCASVQFASQLLSRAFLRTAPYVNSELGEAYMLEGNTLPASTAFLCAALIEFRRRKGIHL